MTINATTAQKGEREEALEACPQIDRLLELSHRLYKASLDHDIYNDILAAASKELDAITDDMERDRLSSSAAEGEMREALEWALPKAEARLEIHRIERLRCGHGDIRGVHADGSVRVGLWQTEVDEIDKARAALSKEPS